jgi:phytoene desaturase
MGRFAERQGARISLGTTVDEITVKDRRVTGVTLSDGRHIAADIVVSNADPGWTYDKLLRKAPRKRWNRAKLARARWSMGLFVWYFGTRGTRDRWSDVGHHTIINGPRYRGLLGDIFDKVTLADDMSLYLHRPSVTDPSVAPAGDDCFYALSPVPNLKSKNPVDWAQEKDVYLEKMRTVLNGVIPGFSEKIAAQHVLTPMDFESRYLSPHGAGFSLEPRIFQSAWFRPHNISEDFDNLYLVGAGTHPGAGIPSVVTSSEVLTQLVPSVTGARVP